MTIRAVVAVVPVHDEEQLLAGCLVSVRRAAAGLGGIPFHLVVVLDACRDRSTDIAHAHADAVISVDARAVGVARQAGVEEALARVAGLPLNDVWTAHTDADTVVPAPWLTDQVSAADAGADVYIGTVRPDFADLDAARRRAWRRTHVPGVANGHVHGANLGVRASILLAAGGFDAVPEHEDVTLVQRAVDLGARTVASDAAWVRTSGRLRGRTPGGYARYLRDDLLRTRLPSTP